MEIDLKQEKPQSAVDTATVCVLSLVWQELEYQMNVRKATNLKAQLIPRLCVFLVWCGKNWNIK
jgi:hypothetical protein